MHIQCPKTNLQFNVFPSSGEKSIFSMKFNTLHTRMHCVY